MSKVQSKRKLRMFFALLLVCISCVLASCAISSRLSPAAQIGPANTPTLMPSPQYTPIPLSPTPSQIACNLNGPYVGVSIPNRRVVHLVNISENCINHLNLGPQGSEYVFGSWLPNGSGFIYSKVSFTRDGNSIGDVCIWDLAQQATSQCLVEKGDNYWIALWSPGSTNYVAYYRSDGDLGREFVTVVNAKSGEIIYETDHSLLENGTAERLFAWHPDGKRILVSVSNTTEQSAVVLDVETGSQHVLATFEGEDKKQLDGLWVQEGANVVLVVNPVTRNSAEAHPETLRDFYWVRDDGTGLRLLLSDTGRGYYYDDPARNQLLISSTGFASGSEFNRLLWLDLQSGTLSPVLSDGTEIGYLLYGLAPDGRYIITLDSQYQTHLYDVKTGKVEKLGVTVLGPIVWRPQPQK